MSEKKLDCCVVRDLLPAYIEELTESETAEQVAAHLSGCEECRQTEQNMRVQVPVKPAPAGTLNFLKHVKRTRLLAAVLAAVTALACMWGLYNSEFRYADTEAGRMAAAVDYVPDPADSSIQNVPEGTPLRIIAHQTVGNRLFLFYGAENEQNVRGIIHLVRGINGKYRTVNATYGPFPFTQGVYAESMWVKGTDWSPIVLAGDGCRDIYSVRVNYTVMEAGREQTCTAERTYPITDMNFLWVMDPEDVKKDLELNDNAMVGLYSGDVQFLGSDGTDITGQFLDESVNQNWGGSKGTAEMGMLYVFMGILALLGVVLVRYFLRRD